MWMPIFHNFLETCSVWMSQQTQLPAILPPIFLDMDELCSMIFSRKCSKVLHKICYVLGFYLADNVANNMMAAYSQATLWHNIKRQEVEYMKIWCLNQM